MSLTNKEPRMYIRGFDRRGGATRRFHFVVGDVLLIVVAPAGVN